MSDMASLSEIVSGAVSSHYAGEDNPGFVSSFVLVAEVMREDGGITIAVSHPGTQAFTQSLGLLGFGEEWIRDDMRASFLNVGDE